MKAFLALLVLLPALALPLAAAHTPVCRWDDPVCIVECKTGHAGTGYHSCPIEPPAATAASATAIPCYGDARAVLVCWTGTDPGCFYFTVLGERAYWLDFCY